MLHATSVIKNVRPRAIGRFKSAPSLEAGTQKGGAQPGLLGENFQVGGLPVGQALEFIEKRSAYE